MVESRLLAGVGEGDLDRLAQMVGFSLRGCAQGERLLSRGDVGGRASWWRGACAWRPRTAWVRPR